MSFALAAFTLGFLGSFHCIGMCGPIALALPLGREAMWKRWLGGLTYNLGRVFTYAAFGAVFGLLGKGFVIGGYQQALSIGLGILLLLIVLLPKRITQRLEASAFIFPFVSKLKKGLSQLFAQRSFSSLFFIGLLNGLLPCGLVYLGVAGAIATGNPLQGAAFMALFGLGTLPAMWGVSVASQFITVPVRNHIRKAVPVFVGIMACALILRGMNLGIPYISPELSKTDCTKHQCCAAKKHP